MPSDPAGCEDVAQATLCRALESLHGYRGEAALMTWLCTICRRELGTRWRENQGWAVAPSLAEDDPQIRAALESLLASEQGDPLITTHREEVRQSILTALDYLPAAYAEILECKYLRDMSVREIAHQMGRSPKATESLLNRARDAFREAFALLPGGTRGAMTP
jgi:RNA polymerase sigma-70 factor (ECF subfamily)